MSGWRVKTEQFNIEATSWLDIVDQLRNVYTTDKEVAEAIEKGEVKIDKIEDKSDDARHYFLNGPPKSQFS